MSSIQVSLTTNAVNALKSCFNLEDTENLSYSSMVSMLSAEVKRLRAMERIVVHKKE